MERNLILRFGMIAAALLTLALGSPVCAEDKSAAEPTKQEKIAPKEDKSADKSDKKADKKEGKVSVSSLPYAKCDEGTKKCKPLKKDKQKYARCMKLMCAPKEEELVLPQNIPGIGPKDLTNKERTCDVGVRKCNALRELGDRYWMCMDQTCADEKEKAKDPFCVKGKRECNEQLSDYRRCVSLMCKSSDPNCAEGMEACGIPLAMYWDCVSGICLGSVEKFKDPENLKEDGEKYETAPNRDGSPRRLYHIGEPNMPILGVPKKFAYAPPGVTEEAHHSWDIPDDLRVTNDMLQKVECRNRSLTITCTGEHLGSCLCSDGSRPAPKKEIEERGPIAVFSDGKIPTKPTKR